MHIHLVLKTIMVTGPEADGVVGDSGVKGNCVTQVA
jgi:hypothetical protein